MGDAGLATTELEFVAAEAAGRTSEVAADCYRRSGADKHGEVAVAFAAVGRADMVVALLACGHDAAESVRGAVAGASGEEMAAESVRGAVRRW